MFKEFLEEVVKKAFNPDLGLFKVHCGIDIVEMFCILCTKCIVSLPATFFLCVLCC